jgi:hypothetical protein
LLLFFARPAWASASAAALPAAAASATASRMRTIIDEDLDHQQKLFPQNSSKFSKHGFTNYRTATYGHFSMYSDQNK